MTSDMERLFRDNKDTTHKTITKQQCLSFRPAYSEIGIFIYTIIDF